MYVPKWEVFSYLSLKGGMFTYDSLQSKKFLLSLKKSLLFL